MSLPYSASNEVCFFAGQLLLFFLGAGVHWRAMKAADRAEGDADRADVAASKATMLAPEVRLPTTPNDRGELGVEFIEQSFRNYRVPGRPTADEAIAVLRAEAAAIHAPGSQRVEIGMSEEEVQVWIKHGPPGYSAVILGTGKSVAAATADALKKFDEFKKKNP